jgi:hypothetical protein
MEKYLIFISNWNKLT